MLRRPSSPFRASPLVSWCIGGSITFSILSAAPYSALAQLSPGDLTPATQSAPAQVEIITPIINKEKSEISLPAAFWNEHLADWVEVAITGRPSDFLHETVAAVTTTKTKMEDALLAIGFHDADAWAASIADFPRVRGDRALILLTVTLGNKSETFSLDELLTFEGWNTSIGPYGWMFKGSPGRAATTQDSALKTLAPNQQILRDDPQIALEFKGLQHLSQSYMDHPLCYDNWIYPDFHYHRNTRLVPKALQVPPLAQATVKNLAKDIAEFLNDPKTPAAEIQRLLQNPTPADNLQLKVIRDGNTQTIDLKSIAHNAQLRDFWMKLYDSNGSVPVQLTIRKVTETELLQQSAAVWHDPAAAKFILDQLPIAAQIDKDKAALWAALTQLKTAPASAPTSRPAVDASITLLLASLDKNYATLDAAWTQWACDHAQLDSQDPRDITEFNTAKMLWLQHMNQKRDRAAALLQAEQERAALSDLLLQPNSPDRAGALRKASALELTYRNMALIQENIQPLAFWKEQKSRLAADDPRQDWRRHIQVQLDRANSLMALGNHGVNYGKALASGDAAIISQTQRAYETATLQAAIASANAQLADVDFEISKRQDFPDDKDLPTLTQRRDALRAQIQSAQETLQKLISTPP